MNGEIRISQGKEKEREVESDAPFDLPCWADVTVEHEVEPDRFVDFVTGVWVDDGKFPNELAKLRSGVVVNLIRKICSQAAF